MGFYVDPAFETKEEWLIKHALPDVSPMHAPKHHMVVVSGVVYIAVCLVDNGAFTAAGICYSTNELAVFAHNDGRFKLWYMIPQSALEPFLFGQRVQ